MKTVHMVQKNSAGRMKFITMVLDGATVTRTWGLIGTDCPQTTANTYDYTNRGRSNEKSPEQTAEADFDRLITLRCEEGYRKVPSLSAEDIAAHARDDVIDFDFPPVSFAPPKPTTKIADPKLKTLIRQGKAKFSLKLDGLRHLIFIGTNEKVKFFTRRMDDHTRKYADMIPAIQALNLPPKTVLDVELVVDPNKGHSHTDAFLLMQGISKSDTTSGRLKENLDRTMSLKVENPVRAMVFDILYFGGEDLWAQPYKDRYAKIQEYIPALEANQPLFKLVEVGTQTFEETMEKLRKYVSEGGEGFVVWNMDDATEVCFTGKPKRKNCWKMKLSMEDDVVAYDFEEGNGRYQGMVGALKIGKYNESGELVPLGKVSGLTEELRNPTIWNFPCTIEIEYDGQFDSGCYQFPRFSRFRPDKGVEECLV